MTCTETIMSLLDNIWLAPVILIAAWLFGSLIVAIWYEIKYADALRRERFYASGLRRGMERGKSTSGRP